MNRNGFTLIELMIVIGIIAIVAAIAIPGILASQRAANERNASASIKSISTANIDYRTNDRNGDLVQNFWCASVGGLYTVADTLGGELRLIDISIALADADADQDGAGQYPALGTSLDGHPTRAKSGYWYEDIETSELGFEYDSDDDDHNNYRYGYVCWPDSFGSSGSAIFIINQENTIYRTARCGLGDVYEVQGGSIMPNGVNAWPGLQSGPISTGFWSTLD